MGAEDDDLARENVLADAAYEESYTSARSRYANNKDTAQIFVIASMDEAIRIREIVQKTKSRVQESELVQRARAQAEKEAALDVLVSRVVDSFASATEILQEDTNGDQPLERQALIQKYEAFFKEITFVINGENKILFHVKRLLNKEGKSFSDKPLFPPSSYTANDFYDDLDYIQVQYQNLLKENTP